MNLRRVAALLVLVLCAVFCLTQLAEVDFYWHLLAGRIILASGRLPRFDDFTWTSTGRPWIDLHWLFQVGAAVIHDRLGWIGLDLLKLGLVVAGFAASLLAAQRRRASLAGPLLLLPGVVAAQERFTLRPEAASFFLFGLLLLFVTLRKHRPRLILAAPALIALWANVEGLFAAGLAALGLVAAGDLLDLIRARSAGATAEGGDGAGQVVWTPLTWPGSTLIAALAAVPASLLTPYGLSAWRLALRLLFERIAANNLYARSIAEFQAPFSGFGPTAAVTAFAIFATLVLAALVLGRRACDAADAFLVAAFLVLALLARRNIPLFVLASLPCASPAAAAAWGQAADVLRRRGAAGRRSAVVLSLAAGIALCAVTAALIVDVVSNRFFARDGTQRCFGLGPAPGFYPEESAGWVIEHDPPRETLNDLTMGGYLAWRWYPARRTYIDGRLETQAESLYSTYLAVQQDPGRFEEEARARGIHTILWSHRHALDAAPLLHHLAEGHGWRLAHVDLAAAVFVREETGVPAEAAGAAAPAVDSDTDLDAVVASVLAQAGEADLRTAAADPMPLWVRGLLPRVEVPSAEVGCGLFFALIGKSRAAEAILDDALRRAPWSAVLHYDVGLLLDRAGEDDRARSAFEEALHRDPGFGMAAAALGLVLARAGDAEGALAAWARAERGGALQAPMRRARGATLAGRGRIDEAIEDYRAATAAEPGQAVWHAELAILYAMRGLGDLGRGEVARAMAIDPTACMVLVAQARLHRADGDRDGAMDAARRAAAAAPRCPEARLELARVLLETGRVDDARQEVQEALRLGTDAQAIASDPVLRRLPRQE